MFILYIAVLYIAIEVQSMFFNYISYYHQHEATPQLKNSYLMIEKYEKCHAYYQWGLR